MRTQMDIIYLFYLQEGIYICYIPYDFNRPSLKMALTSILLFDISELGLKKRVRVLYSFVETKSYNRPTDQLIGTV